MYRGDSQGWKGRSGCYVIAEIGLNHNGSYEVASELIGHAVRAGCDAVKFQKRDVDNLAVSSVLEAEDLRFPSLGKTYRELREKHEFSLDQLAGLKAQAEKEGIDFFATPFDPKSLLELRDLGVDQLKIASHGLTNLPLLEEVALARLPTIISTGMASLDEIDEALGIVSQAGTPVALLHCVSSYPTPDNEARIELMDVLREKFQVPVGYSGHESGHLATLVAVARGASIVERHVTLDRNMEGFDHKLSVEPEELKTMVDSIRRIEKMFGDGIKTISETEMSTRNKYRVSMVANRQIDAGETLDSQMVSFKNPGTGISPKNARDYYGRALRQSVARDTLLTEGDFLP